MTDHPTVRFGQVRVIARMIGGWNNGAEGWRERTGHRFVTGRLMRSDENPGLSGPHRWVTWDDGCESYRIMAEEFMTLCTELVHEWR